MHRTSSRRPDPTPRARHWRWLVLVALCCGWALSACAGGSGSSGFDAVTAENKAIDRALESQACEVNDGLTICASGAGTPLPSDTPTPPPPSATPTPSAVATATATQSSPAVTATASPTGSPAFRSPTPTSSLPPPSATPTATGTTRRSDSPTPTATPIPAQPSVDINIGTADTLPCQQAGPQQPCVFTLTFVPRGAPAAAAYRAAVRTRNPNRAWMIVPVSNNSAAIAVDPAATGTQYQIAVLLFLHEPGFVPDEVELLADTGADFAFVTPPLTAEQIGVP
jgi:hypothetical protein